MGISLTSIPHVAHVLGPDLFDKVNFNTAKLNSVVLENTDDLSRAIKFFKPIEQKKILSNLLEMFFFVDTLALKKGDTKEEENKKKKARDLFEKSLDGLFESGLKPVPPTTSGKFTDLHEEKTFALKIFTSFAFSENNFGEANKAFPFFKDTKSAWKRWGDEEYLSLKWMRLINSVCLLSGEDALWPKETCLPLLVSEKYIKALEYGSIGPVHTAHARLVAFNQKIALKKGLSVSEDKATGNKRAL